MTHRMVNNVRVIRKPAKARWVKLDAEQAAAIKAAESALRAFDDVSLKLAVELGQPHNSQLGQIAKELRTISQQFLYSTDVES